MMLIKLQNKIWKVKKEYFRKSIESKRELISKLNAANYKNLVDAGVKIIDGEASFENNNHIKVALTEGGETTLEAENIIINTGSTPRIPDNIEGIEGNDKVYTSTGVLDLDELPEEFVIVGAGYIGLEFASMYANYGSKVTVIQNSEKFLDKEDRDMADSILKVLESKGVKLIRSASTKKIADGNLEYEKDGQTYSIKADVVLLSIGRNANTSALKLENTDVKTNKYGAIETDDHLKTSASNIWAAGDVRGKKMFTYI